MISILNLTTKTKSDGCRAKSNELCSEKRIHPLCEQNYVTRVVRVWELSKTILNHLFHTIWWVQTKFQDIWPYAVPNGGCEYKLAHHQHCRTLQLCNARRRGNEFNFSCVLETFHCIVVPYSRWKLCHHHILYNFLVCASCAHYVNFFRGTSHLVASRHVKNIQNGDSEYACGYLCFCWYASLIISFFPCLILIKYFIELEKGALPLIKEINSRVTAIWGIRSPTYI